MAGFEVTPKGDNAARYVILGCPRRFFPLADNAASRRCLPHLVVATSDPPRKAYKSAVEMRVEAVYENGVLRPLQPLGLAEHEHVSLTVIKAAPAPGSPQLDIACLESLQAELLHAGPAPGIEEVRRRLSKIPGSMTGDYVAERGALILSAYFFDTSALAKLYHPEIGTPNLTGYGKMVFGCPKQPNSALGRT